jgi:hypothetical protein
MFFYFNRKICKYSITNKQVDLSTHGWEGLDLLEYKKTNVKFYELYISKI